ncbi:MAG: glycosyltransferase family 4 protein [Deltaproteobacteria bacterium]|nr:glycosyltransferase family 4 protein [Deltaproteobacteria bacterium]
MKIAMVTPFLPAPATGGKKIMLDIIRGLVVNNEIYLFSRVEPHEGHDVRELEKYCKAVYGYGFETPKERTLWNVFRIIASYRSLAKLVRSVLKKLEVDVVVVSFTDLGFFLHKTGGVGVPMVLDTHDVNTLVAARRLAASRGWGRKLRGYVWFVLSKWAESYTTNRFDLLTARSDADASALKDIADVPVVAVRQPVDAVRVPVPRKDREPHTLLFVGAMHRELNVSYMRYFYCDVLPLIRKKSPDTVFYMVGGGVPAEFEEWAKRDGEFKVTGFVDDVSSFYNRAAVFVSPILIGGGIMVKNLEAMAHGIPVVTTTFGNEGVGAVNGHDILVADTAESFADAVLRLLNDANLYDMISRNSVEFIRNNFAKDVVIRNTEDAYRQAITRYKNCEAGQ